MTNWKILRLLPLSVSVLFVNLAEAADTGGSTGGGSLTLDNPLGAKGFADIVNAILGALWTLSIPICSIMVMVGGYQILTAAGNEENLKKGRQTITYAVIGFAVITLATGVVSLIRSLLNV